MIETERLKLRKIVDEDAPFLLQLFNDPTFIENINDKGVKTIEQASQFIRETIFVSYTTHGYGPYLIQLKSSDEKIGTSGFYKRDQFEYPDIGYALLPHFTGKGYAFEATNAVLNYGYSALKLPIVYGITSVENKRSAHLLEKIGLQFKEIIEYGEEKEPTCFFSSE